MKITNHWLEADSNAEKIKISKSGNARDPIDPDYLVIHYTATDTAQSAINWFIDTHSNPDRIAAHIVLNTDGTITQLVPFNHRANHAGTSTWDGVDSFNYHAIGIEIVNPGFAEKLADNTFKRVTDDGVKIYPATDGDKFMKIDHKHKFWTGKNNHYWRTFPDAQLQALYKLCKVLFDTYHLIAAVGHDDISPARKPDPGPAFPWDTFKTNVYGHSNNTGRIYVVNTDGTNFRNSFSTNAPVLKKLTKGYEVGLIETNGQWSKVYLVNSQAEVLQKVDGKSRSIKTIGWIFSSLLSLKAGQ
ncbi:N-acetylmuramoyl-L-alanine amidase [Mucilaginibacter sp. OK283]|uniref:N-acetylmuramoyl-L-alanine amidase n=1 Tax=Mucilaginibacter sp. OK283 TaxID=1881049 RepID=UPI0008CF91DD|nr:N-acetylmuramoyl-L-alanine amidase [Mucilaginibacter sp. OK283]SEO70105.1 N-acetylmuramoyl-L-alanine amidase [Mucilaginibacter sp. OK283]